MVGDVLLGPLLLQHRDHGVGNGQPDFHSVRDSSPRQTCMPERTGKPGKGQSRCRPCPLIAASLCPAPVLSVTLLFGINEMDPPLCGSAVISHTEVAQFIAVCSAYIRAETLCHTAPSVSQLRAKRSVS